MARKVYILGTSHEYQRNDDSCPPYSINEFKLYLKTICHTYGINAIGEEMSQTAIEDNNRSISIPKLFTQEHGHLDHKYCDPDRNEQKILGIKESGYFTQTKKLPEFLQPEEIRKLTQEEADKLEWKEDLKREPIWLCKILELDVWPLLFICGPKHVKSFRMLLTAEPFNAKIINTNWEPQSS